MVENPILFFDGTCVLCNTFYQWILKNDKHEVLRFGTLQSNLGQKYIEELKLKPDQETIILVMDGKKFTHSTAALKSIGLLEGGYQWLAKFGLIFPGFIRDFVYNVVAKNRYRIFGKQVCMIPDKNSRFI